MRQALELARLSVSDGAGGPFGALVVREGRILGRGRNRVIADCDPTAHAEVLAIREACAAVGDFHLGGATLYSTCEPCPMCHAAAYWAHLDRVVFAAATADAAAIGFDDGHIRDALAGGGWGLKLASRQLLREDALEVFRLWEASPLRISY
jgi:tRNA(Arg) A34 adenosine deaminase TadA